MLQLRQDHKGEGILKPRKAARQLRAFKRMEDNKGLTVIEGGKNKGRKIRSGKAGTPGPLTEKQETFARLLSEGATNADAYRAAYDCSNMVPNTVYCESSKLASNPKITARLGELLSQKKAKHGMLSEKQGDRVWRNVWRLAEGENVPPSVQQAALALAAKMAGMLTDQVRMETVTSDSKSIEAEILERLQRLSA